MFYIKNMFNKSDCCHGSSSRFHGFVCGFFLSLSLDSATTPREDYVQVDDSMRFVIVVFPDHTHLLFLRGTMFGPI